MRLRCISVLCFALVAAAAPVLTLSNDNVYAVKDLKWPLGDVPENFVVATPLPVHEPATRSGFWEALHWDGDLEAEQMFNLKGGIRRGSDFDDKLVIGLSSTTSDLGLWKGGEFHVAGQQLSSGQPSQNLVGDTQGLSNIAGPSSLSIAEFWYGQDLRRYRARIQGGLMDLNATFVTTDAAGLLLNSSFGIMPSISGDTRASIFPKFGWGVSADKDGKAWLGRLGFFQGDPSRRDSVWHRGFTTIAEIGRRWPDAAVAKVGLWTYDGPAGAGTPSSSWGAYFIGERPLFEEAPGRVHLFLQAGVAPPSAGPISSYTGMGFDWIAPLGGRPDDHLVLGIARAGLRRTPYGAETACELTYLCRLGHVSIQPDVQYIIHPGGALPDALVFTLRLGFALF